MKLNQHNVYVHDPDETKSKVVLLNTAVRKDYLVRNENLGGGGNLSSTLYIKINFKKIKMRNVLKNIETLYYVG